MIRALGIGDNVCDQYRHLGRMFPGGQALNFSVYCRLEGNESAYLGVFGSDYVAEHVKTTLNSLGIDHSHCRTYPGENGYAIVDLKNGDRVFVTSNRGGALRDHPLQLNQDDLDYIGTFDIVHTSNNSYMDPELQKLGKLPCLVSYDFSGSWKDEERSKRLCPYLDFAFLSCSSLTPQETARQIRDMQSWGCGVVVATRGEEGSMLYDGNEYYSDQPDLVEAVDTLGAGDSFAAGFLMTYTEQYRKGLPAKETERYKNLIQDCMLGGDRISQRTCMTNGAFGHGTDIK